MSQCLAAPCCDHLSVGSERPSRLHLAVAVRLLPGAIHPALSSGTCGQAGRFPCSVLHRMRFVVPPSSRSGRWALTPPFHPCRRLRGGGLFSVTLSVNVACATPPMLAHGMLPCGVRTFLPPSPLAVQKRAITPAGPPSALDRMALMSNFNLARLNLRGASAESPHPKAHATGRARVSVRSKPNHRCGHG